MIVKSSRIECKLGSQKLIKAYRTLFLSIVNVNMLLGAISCFFSTNNPPFLLTL